MSQTARTTAARTTTTAPGITPRSTAAGTAAAKPTMSRTASATLSTSTPQPGRHAGGRYPAKHAAKHAAPRPAGLRRGLTTTVALAAAGLVLTPATAFAAGTPHGPGAPAPRPPKPASGPVQTVIKLTASKTPTAAKPVTITARVSPAHRGGPGTPAESGTVVFVVDGTAGAPVKLLHNRASEHVKLAAGKHTVDAKYSGDAAHAASDSGPATLTVA